MKIGEETIVSVVRNIIPRIDTEFAIGRVDFAQKWERIEGICKRRVVFKRDAQLLANRVVEKRPERIGGRFV